MVARTTSSGAGGPCPMNNESIIRRLCSAWSSRSQSVPLACGDAGRDPVDGRAGLETMSRRPRGPGASGCQSRWGRRARDLGQRERPRRASAILLSARPRSRLPPAHLRQVAEAAARPGGARSTCTQYPDETDGDQATPRSSSAYVMPIVACRADPARSGPCARAPVSRGGSRSQAELRRRGGAHRGCPRRRSRTPARPRAPSSARAPSRPPRSGTSPRSRIPSATQTAPDERSWSW